MRTRHEQRMIRYRRKNHGVRDWTPELMARWRRQTRNARAAYLSLTKAVDGNGHQSPRPNRGRQHKSRRWLVLYADREIRRLKQGGR